MDVDPSAWTVALTMYGSYLVASGVAASTVRLRRNQLRRFARFIGERSPYRVGLDDVIAFLGSDPTWQPETRHSMRSAIRGFYAWAEKTGRVVRSPVACDALPVVRRPRAMPRPVPDDVIAEALASAKFRSSRRHYLTSREGAGERLMVMLGAYAGLRRGEIARFHSRWIVGDVAHVVGKGGKTRIVPLHPAILAELEPFIGRDVYVFPGQVDGHVSPNWVGKLLARHLGGGWTGHTLRHRFGTAAREAGGLLEASELLGHESLDTTRIYTRVTSEQLRATVLAVGPISA